MESRLARRKGGWIPNVQFIAGGGNTELTTLAMRCGSVVPHVRPFTEAHRATLEVIYRDCRMEATWLPATVRERSDFPRDTKGETILVAVGGDGEPEGFVSVWEPEGFIHHLYVRSGSRGKGIGEALLDALSTRMPRPWHLKCLRANSAAVTFYLARGWKEVSSGTGEDGPFALLERT